MKRFSISVPNPCFEKWENFNPTSLGGFCSSCQKEVIDFSSWDEDQIKAYFLNKRNDACGRFKTNQLKEYTLSERKLFFSQKWIPASLLSATFFFLTQESEAQKIKKPASELTYTKKHSFKESSQDTTLSKVIIGTVKSLEDSSGIPGVSIVLKGTSTGTQTDNNGDFTLAISNPSEEDVLIFSFIGQETQEVSIHGKNILNIYLKSDVTTLGEMVITGGVCYRPWSPGSIWWKVKNVFRRNR